jgi:isopentenyl phosphate kinase
MNKEEIDIIKLGGSVITDKTRYKEFRKDTLQSLANIIRLWDKKCVIVHGAGSFGHILAKKYSIVSGYKNKEQLEGLSQIRYDMNELRQNILKVFSESGVNVLDFQTSAFVYRIVEKDEEAIFLSPIIKAMEIGSFPLLSGDILFTDDKSFTIYSGDSLIDLLVKNFNVRRAIFITDVDGLMITDATSNAVKLLETINFDDFNNIEPADYISEEKADVTGGMLGKIATIKSVLNHVSEIIIVNGNHPERIQQILDNKQTICTSIAGKKSTKR